LKEKNIFKLFLVLALKQNETIKHTEKNFLVES